MERELGWIQGNLPFHFNDSKYLGITIREVKEQAMRIAGGNIVGNKGLGVEVGLAGTR